MNDDQLEQFRAEAMMRADVSFSVQRNHVIFAPRTYLTWDEDNLDHGYVLDEPATILPLDSQPAAIGNRLRATLLASFPKQELEKQKDILPYFQNTPSKQELFREKEKLNIPYFIKANYGSINWNTLKFERVGTPEWDTALFPTSGLEIGYLYESIMVYVSHTDFMFWGVMFQELTTHPNYNVLYRQLLALTADDHVIGKLVLQIWQDYREKHLN